MRKHRLDSWSLGLLAGLLCVDAAGAQQTTSSRPADDSKNTRRSAATQVPLEALPARVRDGARLSLEKPTMFSRGPSETFACQPAVYYWLMDHPDRAVAAWRKLGAKCIAITDRGEGRFGWSDELGSNVTWETVYRQPNLRIWYAEGKVRPAPLLPLVPVHAVVILRHVEGRSPAGGTAINHQADLFLHTDSKVAALASKLLGASAPRLAEQCLSQLQLFFSGLAWYLERHPDRAEELLPGCFPGDGVPSACPTQGSDAAQKRCPRP